MPARRSAVAIPAVLVALALAGCVDEPAPAPVPTTAGPSATPSPAPDPVLVEGGSAEQNLPYFAVVLERAVDAGATTGGQFVDALAAAGFDRAAMEVTPDRTTVDLAADSVQFSVLTSDGCLVGQFGNVGLRSAALPVLATGRCLVGSERPAG